MNYLESFTGIAVCITSDIARAAKAAFPNSQWVIDIPEYMLLRSDDLITVFYKDIGGDDEKDWLMVQLARSGLKDEAATFQGLREASENPANVRINDLVVMAHALSEYLKEDAMDGWLYSFGPENERLPWLVTDIAYKEESNVAPHVVMTITANGIPVRKEDYSRPTSRTVYFFIEDVQNKLVAECLAAKGLMKESPALKEVYERSMTRFRDMMPRMNAQFWARVGGCEVKMELETRYPERVWFDAPCRVVNDESLIHRKFFTKTDAPLWQNYNLPLNEVPVHPEILCFNLETHTNMWVHVDNLTDYEYDPGLREKLILPEEHRDLIDILTQDMDVLMEDIVEGKSGGTTILCKGAPGLGKTLTAEVYSEVVGKPLYRVHSGQLGVSSEHVERNLEIVLKRAQRWGAVMLIDEADVYIRKRGNDIEHNAVVASFLRTLEYFHGLLFLTTNRSDDVDDAITSRCIATINYTVPKKEDAKRIWRVISTQFEMNLGEDLINELADHFDGVTGRDIKELLKLSAKWCRQKSVVPSLDVFKLCAQFRGL